MTETVEPKPEFRSLSEDAVATAIEDPDPANPIAIEVTRLIAAYMDNFQRHVERVGHIPADILRIKPRWPIEAVAMYLTTKAIRETLAQRKPHKKGWTLSVRRRLRRSALKPARTVCRGRPPPPLHRPLRIAPHDLIPGHNGASTHIRPLLDHDKIANLRIPLDPPQHPRFSLNPRIAADAAVRPIDLGHILNPRIALVRQRRFIFNIPADIAASHIGEIPERPDSIYRPIARLQKITREQFIFFRHARLL
jgi:hypothetical protein